MLYSTTNGPFRFRRRAAENPAPERKWLPFSRQGWLTFLTSFLILLPLSVHAQPLNRGAWRIVEGVELGGLAVNPNYPGLRLRLKHLGWDQKITEWTLLPQKRYPGLGLLVYGGWRSTGTGLPAHFVEHAIVISTQTNRVLGEFRLRTTYQGRRSDNYFAVWTDTALVLTDRETGRQLRIKLR